jgi:hypothetical protein
MASATESALTDLPKCDTCLGSMFTMALVPFTCRHCHAHVTGSHGGTWHYCEPCGTRLHRCVLCGGELPALPSEPLPVPTHPL